MKEFVQTISAAGGTPIAVGTLADLSGIDYPIRVFGLLNDVVELFHPDEAPPHAMGREITEVGY